jgi:hypothetical protein
MFTLSIKAVDCFATEPTSLKVSEPRQNVRTDYETNDDHYPHLFAMHIRKKGSFVEIRASYLLLIYSQIQAKMEYRTYLVSKWIKNATQSAILSWIGNEQIDGVALKGKGEINHMRTR